MISLVTTKAGNEIGYLFDDLFIHLNTIKLVTDGKIEYESKKEGFFEKSRLVIPELKKKCHVLSKGYTEKTGIKYLSILKKNKVTVKRYAYIGVDIEKAKKECKHYIWGVSNFPNCYSIYDTKQEKELGYLLTSSDIYNHTDTQIHICMIELKEQGEGKGTQIIRELLKYRPIRGLAENNSKSFWNKFSPTYASDDMHFKIEN